MGRDEGLAEKMRRTLQEQFPEAKIRVDDEDGIIAVVVSDRFRGKDDFDRQDIVWEPLMKALNREERRQIAIVVPVTTREDDVFSLGSGAVEVPGPTAAGTGGSTAPGGVIGDAP